MLTRIELRNYKCFRSLDIRPQPLCAIVGPNNSGKSSVLQALSQLARTARSPLNVVFRTPFDPQTLTWAGASTPGIGFSVEVETEDLKPSRYDLEISANDSGRPTILSERITVDGNEIPNSSKGHTRLGGVRTDLCSGNDTRIRPVRR